ncbi:MAG: endonuclease/exonuclease/phosphatase family protein, partial [Bacteroidales bacterium]|nr:endonuclease/exonuclease/phosphatase family protein [Bacteroidales bacterium]
MENLFDCRHDTLKNDYDFLPDGSHHWTRYRYWHKLDDISRTLAAVTEEEGQWPTLVGLCEVENDTVLRDLTRRSPLRRAGYQYVVTESDDERGVDVALLYQPERFRLLDSHVVRIPSIQHGFRPTRDILCVSGILLTGDTLHLLVVHLPSRAGYHRGSSRHRRLAVQTLRQAVDSLAGKAVLVMGDFNAEPLDPVFRRLCPPLRSLLPQRKRELRKAQGTYFFQGQWGYLDHMLVSPELY